MADERRGIGGRGMEPIRMEHMHRLGLVSNDWSRGILPRATKYEREELKRNIVRAGGCINPVVTWNGQIVDGHMRAEICDELGIDPPTREMDFESRDHAEAWVIRDQLGRRNLDDVGRCELAEKLEGLLAVAARERMSEGGRISGRGETIEEGPPRMDVPAGADETPPPPPPGVPGPLGGLLDDVLYTKGESLAKAAKVAGISKNKYRNYKDMKKHHLGPPPGDSKKRIAEREAWDVLPSGEKEKRRKEWEELSTKMRGPFPKTPISDAYKEFRDVRKAEERRETQADRVKEANKTLGSKPANKFQPWGADFPTWCYGEFQSKKNLDLLPDGSVKLLLSDPPYGQNFNPDDPTRPAIPGDEDENKAARLLRLMLRKMRPKLHKDAHVVFFCGVKQEPRMRRVLDAEKWLERQSHVVWVKNVHGQGNEKGFAPMHERALHATHGKPGFVKRPTDAFRVPKVLSKDHLTEKPVDLLVQLIEALTMPGEMVADPFGGTASTLVAAVRTGRRAWGAELLEKNYNAGWTNIDDEVKFKQSGLPPASQGARRIARKRKPAASQRPVVGHMSFSMANSAPEPEPSLEKIVSPEAGEIVWGWAE